MGRLADMCQPHSATIEPGGTRLTIFSRLMLSYFALLVMATAV